MEKAEISWFLTIWLFLPRLAFFLKRCLATLPLDSTRSYGIIDTKQQPQQN